MGSPVLCKCLASLLMFLFFPCRDRNGGHTDLFKEALDEATMTGAPWAVTMTRKRRDVMDKKEVRISMGACQIPQSREPWTLVVVGKQRMGTPLSYGVRYCRCETVEGSTVWYRSSRLFKQQVVFATRYKVVQILALWDGRTSPRSTRELYLLHLPNGEPVPQWSCDPPFGWRRSAMTL